MTRAARKRNKARHKGIKPQVVATSIDLAIPPLLPNPGLHRIDPITISAPSSEASGLLLTLLKFGVVCAVALGLVSVLLGAPAWK